MTLWEQYGVRDIVGVKRGYKGIINYDVMPLTPAVVDNIHREGGTFLGSSRGHQDPEGMVVKLIQEGVNQVFIIGGDGTMRGASRIAAAARAKGAQMGVVVVPK